VEDNTIRPRTLFAITVVIGVGVLMIWLGAIGVRKLTADFRGSAAQTEQVHADGAYRIAAYDSFFNQCAAIKTKEASLAALRAELTASPAPSPERAAQLNTFVTAVRISRAEAITRYNADAAKAGTKAQFLAATLPHQIDPNQENTTCTA